MQNSHTLFIIHLLFPTTMAINPPHFPLSISCIFLLLIPTLIFTQTFANTLLENPLCKYTLFPSICNAIFPGNPLANPHDFTKLSISKSLSAARNSQSHIDNSLTNSNDSSTTFVRALEDCQFLAQSNVDFLTKILQTVAKILLSAKEVNNVQTYLSAILTNTETCITGLNTVSNTPLSNGLLSLLSSDTKLFSVSLDLFVKIWLKPWNPFVDNRDRWNSLERQNGKLNLKMSDTNRAIYETVNKGTVIWSDDDYYGGDNLVLVSDVVIVSKDGSGNFTTISDAVAAAPNNSDGENGYFLIYVTAGVYAEYVTVGAKKQYLMIIGDGINETIITGNRNVADGSTTFNSSTFTAVGTGFVAVNITVRNTAGPAKGQAVALRSSADLSTFYHCSFEAYQDTLYVHTLRQFYRECQIYGTIDFIFGDAAVVLQDCEIFPRLPLHGQFNAITAQGRSDPNQNTGISIHNCAIRASKELAGNGSGVRSYLGRPWKEYSRTVYMTSEMGSLINPAGWSVWSGDFALATLYYAEFDNSGPGANLTGRVTWPGYHVIDESEAVGFTVSEFLLGDDWIPKTGVPYAGGLY